MVLSFLACPAIRIEPRRARPGACGHVPERPRILRRVSLREHIRGGLSHYRRRRVGHSRWTDATVLPSAAPTHIRSYHRIQLMFHQQLTNLGAGATLGTGFYRPFRLIDNDGFYVDIYNTPPAVPYAYSSPAPVMRSTTKSRGPRTWASIRGPREGISGPQW